MSILVRIIRWGFGIGFIGIGISMMADGMPSFPGMEEEQLPLHNGVQIGSIFLGITLIILAAVIVAPDLCRLAASPFTAMIDAIFLPGGRADKPDLNLRLPAFYLKEERFDDALAEYLKIIRYHPDEVEGWIGAIALWIDPFDEPEKARKLYEKAGRRFRHDGEARARLEEAWGKAHVSRSDHRPWS
ncbi:MAG: hypothetical protein KDN20_20875 [Verrucomicrobiae bacterium]|nr:hypothetical protein [Verrucomicrobiae bacterium]